MCHSEKIDGFKIIAHNPNANGISESNADIKKILKENVEWKQGYFGPHTKSSVTEYEFEEQRSLARLSQQGLQILPEKVTFDCLRNFGKLLSVMRYWCEETNNTSISVLVLQRVPILKDLY